jgi:hypothetical protein
MLQTRALLPKRKERFTPINNSRFSSMLNINTHSVSLCLAVSGCLWLSRIATINIVLMRVSFRVDTRHVQEAESNLHLLMETMMKLSQDASGTDTGLLSKLETLSNELESLLEIHQEIHRRHDQHVVQ